MSGALVFREAGGADRVLMQQLIVADPPHMQYQQGRGKWHPQPWAVEVQSQIRLLVPPLRAEDELLLLALDDVGIAAASHFGIVDDEVGQPQFMVFALAQAYRCKNMKFGTALMDETLATMAYNRDRLNLDCGVFGRVHPQNEQSKAMLRDFDWEHISYDRGHEVWLGDLSSY